MIELGVVRARNGNTYPLLYGEGGFILPGADQNEVVWETGVRAADFISQVIRFPNHSFEWGIEPAEKSEGIRRFEERMEHNGHGRPK